MYNLCIQNPVSHSSKLAVNWKHDNYITIYWQDVIVIFFDIVLLCWSSLVTGLVTKFHANIITGSGVMTVFFYNRLTRNPDIKMPSSEFCPISEDWGELGRRDTKFGTNVCNEMLLNAAKCKFISFIFLSY